MSGSLKTVPFMRLQTEEGNRPPPQLNEPRNLNRKKDDHLT
jgi:hypothetical protein